MSGPIDAKSSRQRVFSLLRVVVASLVAAAILAYFLLPSGISREKAYRIKCHANLRDLHTAFELYFQECGHVYPSPDEWCDLIDRFVHKEDLRCPGSDKGPCSYAMSPKADPNDAGDAVLLFESKPGWNQCGGPELLTTENHKGQGCSVLFVNGSIQFVKAEELDELKWGDGENAEGELANVPGSSKGTR